MGTAKFESLTDYATRKVDVAIRCEGCRRIRMVPVEELAAVLGWGARIAQTERRLKCTECGHRGAKLAPCLKLTPSEP